MNKILVSGLVLAFISFGTAQAATYIKMPDAGGDLAQAKTGVTVTAETAYSQATYRTTGNSTSSAAVQSQDDGQKATPALLELDTIKGESTDKKAKESGEKGGTEDINIGVGENENSAGQGGAGAGKVKFNEFTIKGGVSVAAGDVNGLTEDEKREFMLKVKQHAQVKSGQDLENFAKGILVENEAMEEISLNHEKITMKHRANGKFLGFLPITFTEEVEIDTSASSTAPVKVKFPWYSFLLVKDVTAADIEADLDAGNEKWIKGNAGWNFADVAATLTLVSNVLKTKHDTAKNSIGNIR